MISFLLFFFLTRSHCSAVAGLKLFMQTTLALNSQRSACHCFSSDEIKEVCSHAPHEHDNFTLELFSRPFPPLPQSQGPSHAQTRGLGGCFPTSMLGSEISAQHMTVAGQSVHAVVYYTQSSFSCQYTLQYTIHSSHLVVNIHHNIIYTVVIRLSIYIVI